MNKTLTIIGASALQIGAIKASNCPVDKQLTVTDIGETILTASVAAKVKSEVVDGFSSLRVDTVNQTLSFNKELTEFANKHKNEDSIFLEALGINREEAILKFQEKILDAGISLAKKIDATGKEVGDSLENSLNTVSPTVNVDAQYSYCEGTFNPGVPGWSINGPAYIIGINSVSGSGTLTIDASSNIGFSLDALVAGATFSFDLNTRASGSMGVSVDVKPRTPSKPSPVGSPNTKTSVGCTMDVKGTGTSDVVVGIAGGETSITIGTAIQLGLFELELEAKEP